MKHLADSKSFTAAKCGVEIDEKKDIFVIAALESDCNECRAIVMVQPVEYSKPVIDKKTDKVLKPSVPTNLSLGVGLYEPEPRAGYENALEELRARREGK